MTKVCAKTLDKASIQIRAMTSQDLTHVVSIECNAHVSPWARLSFEESLTKQHICKVITSHDDIVAYCVICPVVDELHILNIVVAQQYQGVGLGHMLMDDIVSTAKELGLKKIFLEVRISNEVAQGLYLKWRFEQIAIRKRYYRVPNGKNSQDREDALVYLRQLRLNDR